MSDNITLDAGSGGAIVRTDEDGSGFHWQYVKPAFGEDDTQTIVSTTNPLPVDIRADNLSGNLDVNIGASDITLDVQDSSSLVDDAAFTPATSRVTMAGATFDDVAPDSVDEGDAGALRMSANRNLYSQIRDAAGNERGANVNASNQLQVEIFDGGDSLTVDNATLAVTGGGTESGALRVTLANDSTGVVTVDGTVAVTHSSLAVTGGGTESGALRVTLANDSTGVISVDDGGGVLTVDGTVAVTHSSLAVTGGGTESGALRVTLANDSTGTMTVDGTVGVSGTVTVTDDGSFTLAANSGVDIGDVDVTSVTPGFGATNLGKREDDPHTHLDVGVMSLAVRRDADTDTVSADGDYAPLLVDANGFLKVEIFDGGDSHTVDGTVTANAGTGTFTVTDNGSFTLAANSGVDIGDVDVLSLPTLPAGDNNIGNVDVVTLPALPAGTNNIGDVDVLTLPSLPAGTNNIGDVDVLTLPSVSGAAAHDAAVSGNPVPVAARANANEPTAVDDGDSTYLWADPLGRLVVTDGHPSPETPVSTTATSSGETTIIAAPGASLSLYICKGTVHNSDAATEVVGLREPSGSNVWQAELAADGGGSVFDFGSRGWKLTANTALAANLASSGSVTYNITEYYIAA